MFEEKFDEHEVIAFDPGQTTGWCYMAMPRGLKKIEGFSSLNDFEVGEIDCLDEHAGIMSMLALTVEHPDATVVLESFTPDHRMDKAKHTLSPVRISAGFAYGYWRDFGKGVVYQTASQAKSTCTDDRLKVWELYDRYSGPHARDATRHAFLYLRMARSLETKN